MTTLAIHGHFYQPDRRNPLSNRVARDDSAAPAHDWNERIYEQCYAPNARHGNFARIGYDFGPTLLTWLRAEHPGLHAAIAMQSAGKSAMAQGWHHAILPLSLPQDRRTEIKWGISDFAFRFGHAPEGFWLPETAVNNEVLCDLADVGIKYVILAPWQAVSRVDTRRPYRVRLPGGRKLIAVFYDLELSADVSFKAEATENADKFVCDYILPRSTTLEDGTEPLIVVATDGELYGHHKPFRDHFLAALTAACARNSIKMTTVGDFVAALDWDDLYLITVRDNTAWSCHHGIGRWSTGCPCSRDSYWKPIMRKALNELAEKLDVASEKALAKLDLNLWDLRDRYIVVAAGYATESDFADAALAGSPWADDPVSHDLVCSLMAAQRSRLAMFTSCGWFWDDASRPETLLCLSYAADAISKVRRLTGVDAEPEFLVTLAEMHSAYSGESGEKLFWRAIEVMKATQDNG